MEKRPSGVNKYLHRLRPTVKLCAEDYCNFNPLELTLLYETFGREKPSKEIVDDYFDSGEDRDRVGTAIGYLKSQAGWKIPRAKPSEDSHPRVRQLWYQVTHQRWDRPDRLSEPKIWSELMFAEPLVEALEWLKHQPNFNEVRNFVESEELSKLKEAARSVKSRYRGISNDLAVQLKIARREIDRRRAPLTILEEVGHYQIKRSAQPTPIVKATLTEPNERAEPPRLVELSRPTDTWIPPRPEVQTRTAAEIEERNRALDTPRSGPRPQRIKPTTVVLKARSCPRCKSAMQKESDWYGDFSTCLSCGYVHEAVTAPPIEVLEEDGTKSGFHRAKRTPPIKHGGRTIS